MQRNISANWVFPVSTPPLQNGVITVSALGEILGIYTAAEAQANGITTIEQFEGVLVPGFVNTHCHLELSHLLGKIPQKTGLPGFVKEIVALRAAPSEEVEAAMLLADEEMYKNGIVAVGDISNQLVSSSVKQNSKLHYHTFVEVFNFGQPAAPIIENAVKIRDEFWPLKASIVPHAPYSVSEELLAAISQNTREHDILSIHNQETEAENEFFEKGTGSFEQTYLRLNAPKSAAHGNGENAIRYHLPKLPQNNLLLVHNTFTTSADVDFALQQHPSVYWCFCPSANIYIEDNLPDYMQFLAPQVKITLGTDSLASNMQLSILAEMQVLQHKKQIPFDVLLQWATLNGASFLKIDKQYGSFDKGKTPGINLIELDALKNITSLNVKRLF